ncbi:DUF1178 family protein [Kerstersia gyiorum]|uniref:Uncharacterized protein n=1 Tax=Kerstersia gyiorum TaxID=206506 RepID=A0A171KUI4_9BURK|nr:DUF1178 family protein [Kerstersia gyiorum]KKO72551.1 hypothetical protein AAV32_05815 [Kerstersia gyiorum]
MSFKVFDLECNQGHVFEGWFRSHDDYAAQQEKGMVQCPVCQSTAVSRRLSAPSVHTAKRTGASLPAAGANESEQQRMAREIFARVRDHLRQVENVGDDFVSEARRIHAGEAAERPIRGTATAAERQELAEEGIEALAVPFPLDDEALH